MKCKPNDLAIITSVGGGDTIDETVLRSLIGRTVRVLQIEAREVWLIEEPIPFDVRHPLPVGMVRVRGMVEGIGDRHLTPLRGDLHGDDVEQPVEKPVLNPLELALGITSRSYP